jgi:hypothetical protein
MKTNAILVGWNRPIPGREAQSAGLFQEFLQYLTGLQQAGKIQYFEPVLLSPHGGDLNGFILIHGDTGQLDALEADDDWFTFVTRAGLVLDGNGVVRAASGELVTEWMTAWAKVMPT